MGVDLLGDVVLRWDSASNCAPLLEPGGIDAVWLKSPSESLSAACRAAGAKVIPAAGIRLLKLEEAGRAKPGEAVAVKAGVWPGARAASRGADGAFVAGATGRAWVDSNGYLAAWLRALYPEQSPVLAYLPDRDAALAAGQTIAYDSLELALVDAWCAAGNYILAPDAPYREALLAGDRTALAAWRQMGRTARWLKEQPSLFRRQPAGAITVLVEPGQETAEIANLMCRQNASPDLVAAARPPAPDLARRAIVVAAGLRAVSPELGTLLLAHARAGATVVTDACGEHAWWRVPGLKPARDFEDREFHTLASGRVVAYKRAVTDTGDFALDAIDLAAGRRPVRVFDMSAAIASVCPAGAGSGAVLRVVNYGSPARAEIMVHVHGVFGSATLLRPESKALPLRPYRRGGSTEIMLPALARVAAVVFE